MREIKTRTTHGFMQFYLEEHCIDVIFKGDNTIVDETVEHLEEIIRELKTYKND